MPATRPFLSFFLPVTHFNATEPSFDCLFFFRSFSADARNGTVDETSALPTLQAAVRGFTLRTAAYFYRLLFPLLQNSPKLWNSLAGGSSVYSASFGITDTQSYMMSFRSSESPLHATREACVSFQDITPSGRSPPASCTRASHILGCCCRCFLPMVGHGSSITAFLREF
ncbi:hypothetical protein EDD37DRAFT_363936 [Exophiala viscosa]|uniref:uncharacterized protein n=1 Tax=Exophiala viscosa TaxID=2486360 RepID=UPI00219D9B20|nr:hypothetical protein EDD37DRAFT_363936 [Exophiala viscosa]